MAEPMQPDSTEFATKRVEIMEASARSIILRIARPPDIGWRILEYGEFSVI